MNSVFIALFIVSATALSYGLPFLLRDFSIPNVFRISSIFLLSYSLPLSVWNIFILFNGSFMLYIASFTRFASFFDPAA